METIIIKDNLDKIIVNIKNESFDGYRFLNDGRVEKIDNRIYDIFSMFLLSNNYSNLPSENGYDVVLDNETNFKHYFKDGLEDYRMFYLNNGKEAVVYKRRMDEDEELYGIKIPKEFKVKKRSTTLEYTSLLLLLAATLAFGHFYESSIRTNRVEYANTIEQSQQEYVMHEYTLDEVRDRIFSSNGLTEEQKTYLYNEDFLTNILPYVNSNQYANYLFDKKYNNITINYFDHNEYACAGFYSQAEPNVISVADTVTGHYLYDVVAHEFVHMNQVDYKYSVIVEAGAEIMSYEYFEGAYPSSYSEEVKILKTLMEIIGPDPIREYLYTGNDESLVSTVNEYLNPEESELFFKSLSIGQESNLAYIEDEHTESMVNLNNLLETMYTRKYGGELIDDNEIRCIVHNLAERYYFNKKLINSKKAEISYHEKVTSDIMTALNRGIVEDVLYLNQETNDYVYMSEDTIKARNGTFTKDDCFYGFNSYLDNDLQLSVNDNGELIASYFREVRYPLPSIDEKFANEKANKKDFSR